MRILKKKELVLSLLNERPFNDDPNFRDTYTDYFTFFFSSLEKLNIEILLNIEPQRDTMQWLSWSEMAQFFGYISQLSLEDYEKIFSNKNDLLEYCRFYIDTDDCRSISRHIKRQKEK